MPDLTKYQELLDYKCQREIINQDGDECVQADFDLNSWRRFRHRWLKKKHLVMAYGKVWLPKWYAEWLINSVRQKMQERKACRRCHRIEVYAFETPPDAKGKTEWWLKCARCHLNAPDKLTSEAKAIEQGIPIRKIEDVIEDFSANEQWQWRDRMPNPPATLDRFFE